MHRLQSASLFLRGVLATMALALLLPGCGGGGVEDAAPAPQSLQAPMQLAALAAPQVPSVDELFDWAEIRFADLLPGHKTTLTLDVYLYRCYETNICLVVGGQNVYVLVVGRPVISVGVLADFACQVHPSSCVTVSSLNGQALYQAALGSAGYSCSICHGATAPGVGGIDDILNAAGTADSQGEPSVIRAAINRNEGASLGGMGQFSALTDAQLADIAAYINATRWNKTLQ